MAVFPLHCGPLSPGPRGLAGEFEALTSQIKANSHPLLALRARTLQVLETTKDVGLGSEWWSFKLSLLGVRHKPNLGRQGDLTTRTDWDPAGFTAG